MPTPHIPAGVIGLTRRLTASEVALYSIDCGPGGSLGGRDMFYRSGNPELAAYVFQLPSCVADASGLYTVTIHMANNLPALGDPVANPNGGRRKRRARSTQKRRV